MEKLKLISMTDIEIDWPRKQVKIVWKNKINSKEKSKSL